MCHMIGQRMLFVSAWKVAGEVGEKKETVRERAEEAETRQQREKKKGTGRKQKSSQHPQLRILIEGEEKVGECESSAGRRGETLRGEQRRTHPASGIR